MTNGLPFGPGYQAGAPMYQTPQPQPIQNTANYGFMPATTPHQQSASTLIGRVVNSEQEIRPNEVPMNGTPGIFPINGGKHILVKVWGADGTITDYRYTLEEPNAQNTPQNAGITLENISEQLNDLKSIINSKYGYKPKQKYYKDWRGPINEHEPNATRSDVGSAKTGSNE